MDEKPIPKHQIREKLPKEELDEVFDSELLNKIRKERFKLSKEKEEWEKIVNKLKEYDDNIEELEKKRKKKEIELRNLVDQNEKLKNEIEKEREDNPKRACSLGLSNFILILGTNHRRLVHVP